jgi:ribosomal protein S18 acetylase RimI-like enzyme
MPPPGDAPEIKHLFDAFKAELRRLGLQLDDYPGAAMAGDYEGFERLIEHMRTLTPPVSWHDVDPDIPAHWVSGRPETWTTKYRRFGQYDYAMPPAGPVVHVHWPRESGPEVLDRLVEDARAAGWRIYGAGIEIDQPDWPTIDAMLVLERGTNDETLMDFVAWLEPRSDAALAAFPRSADSEELIPDSGGATRRIARDDDAEVARRMHHAAYRDVVERQFGVWDEQRQDEFFADDWRSALFEMLSIDGEPIGYCAIEDRPEDIHVRELVIDPMHQGRGIGTALLRDTLDVARREQKPVVLGTLHANKAIELYTRLGFRQIESTATHVLMKWSPS